MCETCNTKNGTRISATFLEMGGPYVKMAQTPDPAVTTSATAYKQFEVEVRDYFRVIIREAVAGLSPNRYANAQAMVAEVNRVINLNKVNLPAIILRFIERQILAGQQIGLSQIPEGIRRAILPDAIQRQIDETVVRLQRGSQAMIRNSLRSMIGDGLSEGLTVDQLTSRVQEWAGRSGDFERQIKWRARTVARTEASRALNEGQVESWKESGLTRMRWQVAPNPCEFCRMMGKRGQTQNINQPFFGVGETLTAPKSGNTMVFDYSSVKSPPLHPNCRCTLVPIISYK